MPELHVLEQKLNDHCDFSDKKFITISERLDTITERLGSKVSWIVFWSIVCLLVLIVGGMWGILYNEVKSVQNTANGTSTDVSYIKGLLNNADIE